MRAWCVVVLASVAATALFTALNLPSPALFGALVAAMAYALLGRGPRLDLPRRASALGQALVGVAMGALMEVSTLSELVGNWAPILTVCVLTLVVSILAGEVLALAPGVSAPTGVFAMIAGGASGITAVAHELGADDRVVSVVQYLRVVLILFGMPAVTAFVFAPPHVSGTAAVVETTPVWLDLLSTAAAVAGGLLLARWVRFPAASLLLPLFVAVGLSLAGLLTAVPAWVQAVGFVLIGLQVGLRFTRSSLTTIARVLPAAVALVLVVIAASAGLGVLLAAWTGMTPLDGYLATTPGGLYAVLATAVDTGADATFVLAVQLIRLIVMLAAAPLLAAWMRRRFAP